MQSYTQSCCNPCDFTESLPATDLPSRLDELSPNIHFLLRSRPCPFFAVCSAFTTGYPCALTDPLKERFSTSCLGQPLRLFPAGAIVARRNTFPPNWTCASFFTAQDKARLHGFYSGRYVHPRGTSARGCAASGQPTLGSWLAVKKGPALQPDMYNLCRQPYMQVELQVEQRMRGDRKPDVR
jgi:hypothetical protein